MLGNVPKMRYTGCMTTAVSLVALSIAGFLVSLHIHHRKRTQQKLVCIIGTDCDAVVNSKWGKLFGVPNEVLGMLYYVFIAAGTALVFFNATAESGLSLSTILFFVSGIVAFVSVFLIGVQAFVLKDWCDYCLASAGINIAIFVIEAMPFLALYGLF